MCIVTSKMATSVSGVLPESLCKTIKNTKIFMVGAGGIGCELLKNLVLTGFEDIELVSVLCLCGR